MDLFYTLLRVNEQALEWKDRAEEAGDKASMWETTCMAEGRRRVEAETAFEDERARHYDAVRQLDELKGHTVRIQDRRGEQAALILELQSKLIATAQVALNHQNRADRGQRQIDIMRRTQQATEKAYDERTQQVHDLCDLVLEMYDANKYLNEQLDKVKKLVDKYHNKYNCNCRCCKRARGEIR